MFYLVKVSPIARVTSYSTYSSRIMRRYV